MMIGKKFPKNVHAFRLLLEELRRPIFRKATIETMDDHFMALFRWRSRRWTWQKSITNLSRRWLMQAHCMLELWIYMADQMTLMSNPWWATTLPDIHHRCFSVIIQMPKCTSKDNLRSPIKIEAHIHTLNLTTEARFLDECVVLWVMSWPVSGTVQDFFGQCPQISGWSSNHIRCLSHLRPV